MIPAHNSQGDDLISQENDDEIEESDEFSEQQNQ